jgi:hypothetical protein
MGSVIIGSDGVSVPQLNQSVRLNNIKTAIFFICIYYRIILVYFKQKITTRLFLFYTIYLLGTKILRKSIDEFFPYQITKMAMVDIAFALG